MFFLVKESTFVHDEIECEILHEKEAIILQRHTVKRMKNSMTGSVRRSGATVSLTTLAVLKGLTAESALVDLALVSAREWHVFHPMIMRMALPVTV